MRAILVLLVACSLAHAEPIRWASLGDTTSVKTAPKMMPKMAVVEESDCGCSPCRCADHVGACPCGRMPKAKAQAEKHFRDVTKVLVQQPMPQYVAPMPVYQPSPIYWGGVGNVANCVGGA